MDTVKWPLFVTFNTLLHSEIRAQGQPWYGIVSTLNLKEGGVKAVARVPRGGSLVELGLELPTLCSVTQSRNPLSYPCDYSRKTWCRAAWKLTCNSSLNIWVWSCQFPPIIQYCMIATSQQRYLNSSAHMSSQMPVTGFCRCIWQWCHPANPRSLFYLLSGLLAMDGYGIFWIRAHNLPIIRWTSFVTARGNINITALKCFSVHIDQPYNGIVKNFILLLHYFHKHMVWG